MCNSSDSNNHAEHPATARLYLAPRRVSRAAVLHTAAGQTVGFRAPARRGSFIILVVGILALLSVIAVLYATLGSSDRARAGAAVAKKELDDYPDRVRDYIANDVLAKDVLDTIPEISPDGSPGLLRFTRESFDYPFTNWQATSIYATASASSPMFTPTGGPLFRADGSHNVDPATPVVWIPGDPWLASNEPTFLDIENPGSTTNPSKLYLERRDWAHISNLAPDGRFVNLALLRNNFDISSRSLTANLGIPGRDGDFPGNMQNIPGTGTPRDAHHPAHFDSMQVGAFRPMFDSRLPSDPKNIFNQWADADGDGFADSRWFELVDASHDSLGITEFSLIPHDSNIRYFVAARVIDLSGLINVNTATDQKSLPVASRPIGSSPSEVDLRTALMLENQSDYDFVAPSAVPGNPELYEGLYHAPDRAPTAFQNYAGFNKDQARSSGTFAYSAIKLSLAAGVPVPPRDNLIVPGQTIWYGFSLGGPLANPRDPSFASQYNIISGLARQRWDFDTPANGLPAAAEMRFQAYIERQVSILGSFFAVDNSNNESLANRGVFGLDDQLELLKFGGANDYSVTSSLEMVAGARGIDAGGNPSLDFSPLRDNRTRFNERPERPFAPLSDDTQWDQFRLARMIDIRQRLTTVSWAREIRLGTNLAAPDQLSDSESRVNPVSLLSGIGTPKSILNYRQPAATHRVDIAFNSLFNAYLSALAPYVTERDNSGNSFAWGSGGGQRFRKGMTLSYGHQSAEFALITSAFLAMNMADKFDADSIPQARTLLIDNDFRTDLANDAALPLDQQKYPWWHGTGGDADAELGVANTIPSRLGTTGHNDSISGRAVNLYGTEPQVFITAATTFTVYTDAPTSVGGDDEADTEEITIKGALSSTNSDFVMRAVAFQLTNPFNVDVQLGASELGNGYPGDAGVPNHLDTLDVGDPNFPPFTRFKDYFYIEYGGRQYALVRLEDQPVTGGFNPSPTSGIDAVARPIIVPAGESIVVYALSQVPRSILKRLKDADPTGYMNSATGVTDAPARYLSPLQFRQMIRNHIANRNLGIGRPRTITNPADPNNPFNATVEQDGIYWIPEFFSPVDTAAADPNKLGRPGMTSGAPDPSGGSFKTFEQGGITTFSDLLTPGSSHTTPDNQEVKLWRSMRAGLNEGTIATYEWKKANIDLPTSAWDGGAYVSPVNPQMYVANDRHDDLLVDRMRLPDDADFNRNTVLPLAGNNKVGQSNGLEDNTGYTITLWDAANRPADPSRDVSLATAGRITSGSLPAYCIERKLRIDPNGGPTPRSWNIRVHDSAVASPPTLTNSQFTDNIGARGAHKSIGEWFKDPTELAPAPTGILAGSNNVVIEPLGRAPSQRRADGTNSLQAASRSNSSGPTGVEKPDYINDRPELIVDNNRYGMGNSSNLADCSLRTADMLSPLAVGAINDPDAALPPNWATAGLKVEDVQWTTLSEALCLALGYEVAPIPDGPCAIQAMYSQNYESTGTLYKNLYDHAQLRLDDFVPFLDANADGQFTENIVQGNPANSEYRRGSQTPLAWNVLDVFSTRATKLDTAVPGVININTASQSVLASLPMLAPPTWTADVYLNPSRPSWWGPAAVTAASDASHPAPTFETTDSDLTATVAAARDKDLHFFRPNSAPALIGPTVSFWEAPVDASNAANPNYSSLDARFLLTDIPGISELPGFRTPGGILSARANAPDKNVAPVTNPDQLPMNIKHLGSDVNSSTSLPADSSVPGVTPGLTMNWYQVGNVGRWVASSNLAANDYQEKLAIAGAALGSTTNRSDTYAVWFVVQGYTKDDVTVANNDTPMVPSVKRRFVMIVDRSNVRQVGDKPRILLFKEVPAD